METELYKYFLTQGPFAILFIWMLLSNQKREREAANDSKAREKELNVVITKQNEILQKFSEKYDLIIAEIRKLEGRIK